MESKKRARIAKKKTIELITHLKKERKLLLKKDQFNADILSKILKDVEWRQGREWELALEDILANIYKYDIPLREQTKSLCNEVLDYYDRPNWTIRGQDLFGDAYDELKIYYKAE